MSSETPSTNSLSALLRRLPRLSNWWLIAVALSAVVLLIAPQQLPVSLYKLSLISLAALAGYWLDRALYPYARPHELDPGAIRADAPVAHVTLHVAQSREFSAAMLRRAVIVAAAMISVALGA